MPYLTPDTPPSGRICRTISIPADWTFLALINGALTELTKVWNWEQFGTLTPQEAADFFQTLFDDFRESECDVTPIGMIAFFAQNDANTPAKWLFCDGAAVSRATYAGLFAVIGVQYGAGNGTTTFNIPDLRNRFVLPANAHVPSNLGFTGGEATHVLTVTEMPQHSHEGHVWTGAGGVGGNQYVAGTRNGVTGIQTGNAGNNGAHNNMPPYIVLTGGIYAGV